MSTEEIALTELTPSSIGLPEKFTSFRYDERTKTDQFDTAYSIASSDKRFTILASPPGSGKTLINMAAGLLAAENNYRILYLVSTNQLLQQVYDDFKSIGVKSIIGMGNYVCNDAIDGWTHAIDRWTRRRVMCNEGKCLSGLSCSLRSTGCDYYNAVDRALNSSIVLSNFAYRASCARYSDPYNIGKFDLVICDEAHLLLDWMTGFCTIELDVRDVRSLLCIELPATEYGPSLESWSSWARDHVQIDGPARRSSDPKINKKFERLKSDLLLLSHAKNDEWVVEQFSARKVEITPIEPTGFLEKYIYLSAPKIILSSASVTESDAQLYGCSTGDYQFIIGGSGFPVKNRPLIYIPTCTVKHRMTDARRRLWLLQIDHLCELGSDHRGIIHSVSYSRMMEIYESSAHRDRMIIHSSSGSRGSSLPPLNKALELYRTTPQSILVSPVVGTGHDFKDDDARWQIICKIPFLNPHSPIVKARKRLWKSKYKLDYMVVTAAKTVVQMYGRPTRSLDDWSTTWIIDDPWGKYVGRSRAVPMYVKNAMSTCRRGSPPRVEKPV